MVRLLNLKNDSLRRRFDSIKCGPLPFLNILSAISEMIADDSLTCRYDQKRSRFHPWTIAHARATCMLTIAFCFTPVEEVVYDISLRGLLPKDEANKRARMED